MSAIRIFLTGDPRSGKTTAVQKIVRELTLNGVTVGGIISGEIRELGMRVGFSLQDVSSHEMGALAHVSNRPPGAQTVGKYSVNLVDIEKIGVTAIRRAINNADVIVVDEIGPMELKSTAFVNAVRTALASKKRFLGTLHKRASHDLVATIRSEPEYMIIEIDQSNRSTITSKIVELLMR